MVSCGASVVSPYEGITQPRIRRAHNEIRDRIEVPFGRLLADPVVKKSM